LIQNFRILRLTTCVTIALCTTRNLSCDRGVAPHVYIKSGITSFPSSISWAVGLPSLAPKPVVGLPNWNRPNWLKQIYYSVAMMLLTICALSLLWKNIRRI